MLIKLTSILLLLTTLSTSTEAVTRSHSPTPAPAPPPNYVNLTDLLTVTGPFHTFLSYLQQTQVLQTLQNQANNTHQGITIFVPKDSAFTSLKNPSLSKLTQPQLKSLLLFHALPRYYTLADFNNLSLSSPVATLAGGPYTLNFTDASGSVHLSSGWTSTKISSSVRATVPVAVYQIDKVLLPQAIFGAAPPEPPPAPAPAPAPSVSSPTAPAADQSTAPAADTPSRSALPSSSTPSSSCREIINWGVLLAVSGGFVMLL